MKVGLVILPELVVTVILFDSSGELPLGSEVPGAKVTGPLLGC